MAALTARTLTLGSRPSKLAQWQTQHTLGQLQAAWPGLVCRLVTLVTEGDRVLDKPLPAAKGSSRLNLKQPSTLGRLIWPYTLSRICPWSRRRAFALAP
jgi:hypothetical protein